MENHRSPFRNRPLYQEGLTSQAGPAVPSVNDLLYNRGNKVDAKKSLEEGLESLRRGKWLILSIFLLVVGGVAGYTFLLPPEYEAQSLLLVSPQQSSSANPVVDLGLLDGAGLTDKNLANQVLILEQSLLIAERTAERLLDLQVLPSTGEPLPILERDEEDPPLTVTALALYLQNNVVSIKLADEQTDGIWIASLSSSPEEAALIANLYAEEYVKRTRETSRERITATRVFLEQQIAKRREQLLDFEDRIKNYMSREGAVALDEASQYTITQIAQLEASLDETRIEKSMHEASLQSLQHELQRIHPRLAERVASGVESDIRQTQQRIAELELAVEQIYIRNPALRDNPDGSAELKSLISQIEQLKLRAQRLAKSYVDEMLATGGTNPLNNTEGGVPYVVQLQQQIAEEQIAISGAEAKISALEQRLSEYDQRLRSIPEQSIQIAQLERGRNSAEQLFNSLVEKLQATLLAEESELGFGQVIRPALMPSNPVRPNPMINLLLGGIMGLGMGIAAALARHKLDTRVYSPDDLRKFSLNMLGVVPDMRTMIKEEFGKKAKVLFEDREVSTTLAALLTPFSPVSEAYRRLYTSLQFGAPGVVIQTVMVTSPEAQAGKSTTALNLAITAARTGRRTLVVDADLRRPVLKNYLDMPPHPELSAILLEEEPMSLQDLERFATGIDNVYAITAEEPVDSPAEMLGSRQMRDFIEKLRGLFDLVIFDTPPVLVATDAVLLSTQCDATIMVASSGSTDIDALRQTIGELEGAGARVVGTILNRFNPSRMIGYKYTYGYRYGYGYSKYTYGSRYQKNASK